ncbi:LysR family transcriptional regulator [Caballeronia arationis]|jgi:DNA-binding transcriptional LysR family regulator|uniref:LysR substrate-binding domain-containing protein n=1 Tax=Caballeronia arationis TaxID=1777142 RepID=UPI00074BDD48|nr:LysR substrate-binding domain-containing protein [Caballeronia arationis]SAL06829.1 LysR family transcriptional regulator [Caballeronia arationis]
MSSYFHYDLQSLRIFIVVAEVGSLTKASERTNITLGAVSKRIADLERSTGCALLLRQPRGVELTAAGKGLLAHARQVVERVNRMANEMSDYATGVRGHVRMWANTSAVVQFLPRDVRTFLTDNPSVKISLEERLSGDIVAAVRSGDADIGIFADNVPAPDIEKAVYRRDKLVLLVPNDHPLAAHEGISFVDTLNFEYVGLNEGSSLLARLLAAAFSAERTLKVRIQVSSFDGICRMIEQGLGIGVLPEAAVRNEILAAGLHQVRLFDEWADRTLFIGTRSLDALSPEASRLFKFMTDRNDP